MFGENYYFYFSPVVEYTLKLYGEDFVICLLMLTDLLIANYT